MEFEFPIQKCIKCKSEVSQGDFFCSSCGTAQVENTIIYEKSTANWDPMSQFYKPWRDEPLVEKKSDSKEVFRIKEPWRYTKRNANPMKKKKKGDKTAIEIQEGGKTVVKNERGVRNFLGLRFRKAGSEKLYGNGALNVRSQMIGDSGDKVQIQRTEQVHFPLSICL